MTVVVYGCEIWWLTLKEESRLTVFENRMVRRIFVPERDEITGKWVVYLIRSSMICTPHPVLFGDQIEKNEMGGACSTCGKRRGVYRVLVGKPEGWSPLGRPKHR